MNTAGQKKAGKEKATKPAAVEPKSFEPAPAAKPPAAEYDDMVEDAPAADPAADPRDAQIKALTAQVADYKEALDAELAENTRIGNVLDADDKVAAALSAGSDPAWRRLRR